MISLRETLSAFWNPELKDERQAARNVWEGLPEELRVSDQVLGRHSAGCAATYGVMEACDFYCTACYLSDEANHTPPLPFEEIKEQVMENWVLPSILVALPIIYGYMRGQGVG